MKNQEQLPVTVLFNWDAREELKNYLTAPFKNNTHIKLVFPHNLSEENILILALEADIIVGWRPSIELLKKATKLKLYINPGAGVQHLLPLFREIPPEREIILVNGHGNSYFTAQHAVAMLLSLMNKIIPHHNWLRAGRWRTGDDDAKSIPLRDKNVGLLGYGAINSKVHKFLSGFDLNFAVLRNSWEERTKEYPTPIQKFTLDALDEFLEWSDILMIALPLTKNTQDLIRERELILLGKSGLIVNIARGAVINEKDLFTALQKKEIAGAALDVWYNYQPEPEENGRKFPSQYPFDSLDNVVLSPHRGASPFDDLKRWDEVIENISRLAHGRSDFLNQVDLKQGY